jgi:hypothetical protein
MVKIGCLNFELTAFSHGFELPFSVPADEIENGEDGAAPDNGTTDGATNNGAKVRA